MSVKKMVYICSNVITDKKAKELIKKIDKHDEVIKQKLYLFNKNTPPFLQDLIEIARSKMTELNLKHEFTSCIVTNYNCGPQIGKHIEIDFGSVITCFALDHVVPIEFKIDAKLTYEIVTEKKCLYILVK